MKFLNSAALLSFLVFCLYNGCCAFQKKSSSSFSRKKITSSVLSKEKLWIPKPAAAVQDIVANLDVTQKNEKKTNSQVPVQQPILSVTNSADNVILTGYTKTGVQLSARLATEQDFINIAKLRLSIFALCNPLLRSRFVNRSVELIKERRDLGSVCIVVTAEDPSLGRPVCSDNLSATNETSSWDCGGIIGSLECSVHEFGKSTMAVSAYETDTRAYITEVAVHGDCRRQGVGAFLLAAAEAWARGAGRGGGLWLHVNDLNEPALALYAAAGYGPPPARPEHRDFTDALGLGGTTLGCRHTLLVKDVLAAQPAAAPATTATGAPSRSSGSVPSPHRVARPQV